MKQVVRIACLALTAIASFAAQASLVTWTLVGATLSDGSTADGSFTYDATTSSYSNYSIHYSAGSVGADITYGASASVHSFSSASNLVLTLGSVSNYMNLAFDSALTNAGGTIAISLDPGYIFALSSWECTNCGNVRTFTGGSVTSTPVPEPAPLLLVASALVGLALTRRR